MPEASIFQQFSPKQKVQHPQSGPQSDKFSVHDFLTRHFAKKIYYDLFTELGFSVDYPEWQKSKATTSDLVLSVSNGKFEMEVYVEPAEPYTFASYLRKVTSAIRGQLNAKIIKKSESVDSAYMEFVLVKQNVLWLYKARIVECNKRFYTVSFNCPKKEFYKMDKVTENVFASMECYIPENSKSVKFKKGLEDAVAEEEFRKMPDIEELSAEEEFAKLKETPVADREKKGRQTAEASKEFSSQINPSEEKSKQVITVNITLPYFGIDLIKTLKAQPYVKGVSLTKAGITVILENAGYLPKLRSALANYKISSIKIKEPDNESKQRAGIIEINAQKALVPETRYEPKVKIFEERENTPNVESSKKVKVIEYEEKD